MRFLVSALGLAWLAGAEALACPRQRRELGGFSLLLPAAMTLQAGGTDSYTGRLVGVGLQIEYDLGLYADPLQARAAAVDRTQRAVTVDGHAGWLVRWREPSPAPTRCFIGLHLPQVRDSIMGPLRLTLLAWSLEPAAADAAQTILLSLRLTVPLATPDRQSGSAQPRHAGLGVRGKG